MSDVIDDRGIVNRVIPPLSHNDKERFLRKVSKYPTSRGCFEWLGGKQKGYGRFQFKGECFRAHRIAFLIANGICPSNLHVLHKCDNRGCMNPSHLFLGTDIDNINDRVAKDRSAKGAKHGSSTKPMSTPRGERHAFVKNPSLHVRGENVTLAKLNATKVKEIRHLRATTSLTLRELGRMFGVNGTIISKVALRQTWKHIN